MTDIDCLPAYNFVYHTQIGCLLLD